MPLLKELLEKVKKVNRRLLIAMICYAVIIAVAFYGLLPVRTQQESYLLIAVLLVIFLFIVKTLVHAKDE
jgi:hypothetical protein